MSLVKESNWDNIRYNFPHSSAEHCSRYRWKSPGQRGVNHYPYSMFLSMNQKNQHVIVSLMSQRDTGLSLWIVRNRIVAQKARGNCCQITQICSRDFQIFIVLNVQPDACFKRLSFSYTILHCLFQLQSVFLFIALVYVGVMLLLRRCQNVKIHFFTSESLQTFIYDFKGKQNHFQETVCLPLPTDIGNDAVSQIKNLYQEQMTPLGHFLFQNISLPKKRKFAA